MMVTITARAATPNATGHVGALMSVMLAKITKMPVVQLTELTCLVRSESVHGGNGLALVCVFASSLMLRL